MKGFKAEYSDLPDYILKCTARIWEGRDITALDWHYADNLRVRTPVGINHGNQASKASTLATLAECSDRQLLGEDVILCGDGDAGLLSSHRILSTAPHRGSAFGPAGKRSVVFRTIADTYRRGTRIWDEWLICDDAAIAVQLRTTARDVARDMIVRGDRTAPLTPRIETPGPCTGVGNDNVWGRHHANILRRIVIADFAVIFSGYDQACHVALPGGRNVPGHASVDRFWIGLRAAFSATTFEIHHQIGRQNNMFNPRSAVGRSLTGPHDGWRRYGAPTGTEVHVMDVSHVEFGPRGSRREAAQIDDIAIWKQLLLRSGDIRMSIVHAFCPPAGGLSETTKTRARHARRPNLRYSRFGPQRRPRQTLSRNIHQLKNQGDRNDARRHAKKHCRLPRVETPKSRLHRRAYSGNRPEEKLRHHWHWPLSWGQWGDAGEAMLDKGDIFNIPVGLFRGSENIGTKYEMILAILDGDDAGDGGLWVPKVIDGAAKHGLILGKNGILIGSKKGEVLAPGNARLMLEGTACLVSPAMSGEVVICRVRATNDPASKTMRLT